MLNQLDLRNRSRAAAWHLLLSACVAALAGALVFGLWYPGPYRLLSGGRELFVLVTGVDIVLGPVLTFSIFDLRKGWPHLRRDLAVIVAIQMAGLVYGLHTVYVARPVALVFEIDRFRVVAANAVRSVELPTARAEYRQLPLTGPWLLGVRQAKPGAERNDALFMAIDGVDTGQRPMFWTPFDEARPEVLRRARLVKALIEKYPQHKADILDKLQTHSLGPNDARFVPVIARGDWVALIDAKGTPVEFLPLDGYF